MYGLGLNNSDVMTLQAAIPGGGPVEPGLAMWIDASDTDTMLKEGDNGNPPLGFEVDTCLDKSGNGNDWTELSASRNPLLTTDGGRQVLDFQTTSDYMGINALGDMGTIFMVYRGHVEVDAATGNGDWLRDMTTGDSIKSGPGTSTLTDEILWVAFGSGPSERSGWESAVDSIDNTDYHLYTFVYNATDERYDIYLDGVFKTTGTTTHSIWTMANGGRVANNQAGRYAEVLVYNDVKDSAFIAAKEAALTTKWNL
jgi:hypothetical protein